MSVDLHSFPESPWLVFRLLLASGHLGPFSAHTHLIGVLGHTKLDGLSVLTLDRILFSSYRFDLS
jgi:hypothetical protein